MDSKKKPVERTKKRLNVKAVKKGYHSWFYVVEHAGRDYEIRMFDFQKGSETPDSIACLIEKSSDGQAVVKIDMAPLIAQRYKVGEIHRFKVRKDEKHPFQYNAASPEGFNFHLLNPKGKSFADRTEMAGRIKSINDVWVEVEEVEAPKEGIDAIGKFVEPGTIRQIAEDTGVSPAVIRWSASGVGSSPDFAETRALLASQSPDWLCEAVRAIREGMPRWVAKAGKLSHQMEVLRGLRSVGIQILEQSNLATGSTADAKALRTEISRCVNKADEYGSAISKIQEKSIGQYAQSAVSSLERTGYIYEPTHRLNVISSAMAVDRGLIAQWMPAMLATLAKRSESDWKSDPLRLALVDMLSTYVEINSADADRVIDLKLGDNKAIVSDVIRASAMILMLTTEEDDVNRRKHMARLCRYSSLYGVSDITRQGLNDRAFGFLLTRTPSNLPFVWSDLRGSADIISVKTSSVPYKTGPDETVRFDGRRAAVEIRGRDVTIRPAVYAGRRRDVLPEGVGGWLKFHVAINNRGFSTDVKGDSDDIDALRRMWREVEDSLFDPKDTEAAPAAPIKVKSRAEAGDEVTIRITGTAGKDTHGNPQFKAVIVSDTVEGEGVISPRDIVHYNVKYADVRDFADEQGRPFLFKAKVAKVLAGGALKFTMQELVGAFVGQTVQEGEEVLCLMTIKTPGGDDLLISEHGYSLKVVRDEDSPYLENGDLAYVEVIKVYPDGNIDGVYIPMPDVSERMRDNDCFHNILTDYAEGVYEAQEGDEDEEEEDDDDLAKNEMGRDDLRELMDIVDRQSTLAAKRSQAFNLLALARLLALAMDDTRKAEEYHDRMSFIHLMQQYAVNQWIDTNEFEHHYQSSKGLLEGNPDMQDQVLRLFCISRMDKEGSLGDLARLTESRRGTLTAEVASLVMAYNALKPYEMEGERRGIRNKINELLGVETRDISHLVKIEGEEGATQEFKSSLVFPPDNNQRPNKEKQCKKLLTVVCGMMNEKGGHLFVGANDQGYAVGLDSDFRELAGYSTYDEQKMRDVMQNFFVTMLRSHMSSVASLYVDMRFVDYNGRSVFVVDVKPSKEVVSVDGEFFRRVGNSTREMDEQERKAVEALKKGKN